MSTASRSFVLHVGNFIRTLGCVLSRADLDTWIKKDPNYDAHTFILIHVDNVLIIGTDPAPVMEAFDENFDVRHDELNPTSHLGLEWVTSKIVKTKIHN